MKLPFGLYPRKNKAVHLPLERFSLISNMGAVSQLGSNGSGGFVSIVKSFDRFSQRFSYIRIFLKYVNSSHFEGIFTLSYLCAWYCQCSIDRCEDGPNPSVSPAFLPPGLSSVYFSWHFVGSTMWKRSKWYKFARI